MKYNQKNRRIHIGIWLFCALFSMLGILLFCGHTEKKASAADYDKLKQQIITAYQKYETSVNVKAYKLYNDTATSSKISSMFEEIMNETPYLFYNGRSFSKAIEADSNQILTIGLEYSNLYKKNGKVDVSKIEKDNLRNCPKLKKILFKGDQIKKIGKNFCISASKVTVYGKKEQKKLHLTKLRKANHKVKWRYRSL